MTNFKNVQQNYKLATNYKDLAILLNLKENSVKTYLCKLGIKYEGSGGKNRKINYNPFIEKSDKSDYWLGFIAADGNISSSSSQIAIVTKDIAHLYKYKNWIGDIMTADVKDKPYKVFYFSNREVKNYLVSEGITSKKSKTLELKRLNWAILRGIFDGDGHVSFKDKKYFRIKITSSSIKLLTQIKNFLKSENINCIIRDHKDKNSKSPCWNLEILKENKLEFVNNLYNNADVYLERKFDIMRLGAEKLSKKSRELLGPPSGKISSQA